ncbi:unnamed protein product [Prorocentrum cordatum]|uniref:Cyclic nucleotide-binding domain-containing protein n=1 Tax=Prorocentrum cordatum TaxID=2364126 RepID=A0ABN9VEB5_9DINO|nr:unnamed protein product [Polarella glacialis]
MMRRLYQCQDQSEHHMLLLEDDIIPTETSDASSSPVDEYLIRCFKHETAKIIAGVMLTSILVTSVAAPLTFIWGATWKRWELVPGGMKILVTDVMMDVVFLVTCLLSLNTSYMDPKYRMEVVDRRKIVRRYMGSKLYIWMIFTTTCHFWTSAAQAPMLINVVKTTRVWQFFDLPDALIWWRDRRRYRFGRLVLLLVAGAHCVACLLAWGTGYREIAEEQGYDQFETNFNGETISGYHSLYWMALVESVFLLTGGLDNPVGDGSMRDRNFGSLVFVTIMGPVGCLIVAIVISLVTREQTLKYALDMHHEEKKAFMKRAMDTLMIPSNLQRRVFSLHYFQRMSHDKLALKELLKSENLSKPLELSLRLFIYRRVVMSGFFDTTHQNYILEVVRVLEDHIYIPGDYVCRRGEMGNEMFFVNQGELGVLVPGLPAGSEGVQDVENAIAVGTKKSGEYFGEIVLIKRTARTAWVRANGYVVCAVLTRDNVEMIWKFFPCEREKVVKSVTAIVCKDRWRAVRNKVGDMRSTMAGVKRANTQERGGFASDQTEALSAGAGTPAAAGGADRAGFDGVAGGAGGTATGAGAPTRLSLNVKEALDAENNEAAAALDSPEERSEGLLRRRGLSPATGGASAAMRGLACLAAVLPQALSEEASSAAWPGALEWPGFLGEADGETVPAAVLNDPASPCGLAHQAVLRTVERGTEEAAAALGLFVERVPQLLEALELQGYATDSEGAVTPYAVLFGGAAQTLRRALDGAQLLGLVAMARKRCFSSAARLALGQGLLPLSDALRQQLSTMWWMFDIGQYSNTNSPAKHLEAVLKTLRHVEAMFGHLASALPGALADDSLFWGHEAHGMFINSTVVYRTLFPESAIVDKGLLRRLLRILPPGASLADFGSLDGQYSKWLNDTGWVTAFAFDGVEGVTELTGGAVTQADLAEELAVPWHPGPFDWVLCLEVAEHVPPEREHVFLSNLARHAGQGLVLSWAPPGIEGEGHVNCLELEESRRRVEALGLVQDEAATAELRAASHVPWISASVAVYRRRGVT